MQIFSSYYNNALIIVKTKTQPESKFWQLACQACQTWDLVKQLKGSVHEAGNLSHQVLTVHAWIWKPLAGSTTYQES